MKKNNLLILLVIYLVSLTSYASREVGNGGDGIIINGKPYLYDLVEAGVYLDPNFNETITTLPEIKRRVNNIFTHAKELDKELVAKKFTEIYYVDKIFFAALMRVMEMYSWRWVDFSLFDIPDDGDTVVNFDRNNFVQLAARYNRSITIDLKLWLNMTPSNRVALLFHEAIYALIAPTKIAEYIFKQDANLARQVTGFLFTGELALGKSALSSMLQNYFPNESMIFYKKDESGNKNNIKNIGFNGDKIIFGSHIKLYIKSSFSWIIIRGSDIKRNFSVPIDFDYNKSLEKAYQFICKQISDAEHNNVKINYLFHNEELQLSFMDFHNKNNERATYINFSFDELDKHYYLYNYRDTTQAEYIFSYMPPSRSHRLLYDFDGTTIENNKQFFKKNCSKGAPIKDWENWYNNITNNYEWIE
ncbi:MAG: hypothetical protein MK008_07895 [Bdellovibrionales bacterium]|nr:hypothetical protein [Bdellovibrionales bacterium]